MGLGNEVTLWRFEHTSKPPEETSFRDTGGAESGALARVVDAWDTLPEHIKDAIATLVKSGTTDRR